MTQDVAKPTARHNCTPSFHISKLSPVAKSCQASDAPKLARVAILAKLLSSLAHGASRSNRVTRGNVAQMRYALFLPNVAARDRLRSNSRSLRNVNNLPNNHQQQHNTKHAQKETRLDEFLSLCEMRFCYQVSLWLLQ